MLGIFRSRRCSARWGDGGRHVEKPNSGANRLLQSLEPADLAALQSHLKPIELRRGDVLHQPRAAIEHVYFPLSGMVSLLAVMQSGEAIETAIVGREGLVGGSVANGNGYSFGQATVQIAGKALRIASRPFTEACGKSGKLRALANHFQDVIMMQAQQNAACHALHTVDARLCRWLLQSQDATESNLVELTQEVLSHMLGVQRTSVTIAAHALQEAGLIKYSRGRITILDRAGIEECACECYAVLRSEIDRALPPVVRQV
jgi:CRP-like cAMP-binding protein